MVAPINTYASQLKAHKAYQEAQLMREVYSVRSCTAPEFDSSVGEALENTYHLENRSGEKQIIKVRRDFVYGQEVDTVKISIKANEAKPEHPGALRSRNRSQSQMLASYEARPELAQAAARNLTQYNKIQSELAKWTPFKTYRISELPRMLKYKLAKDFAPENPALVHEDYKARVEPEANRLVYELVK